MGSALRGQLISGGEGLGPRLKVRAAGVWRVSGESAGVPE